MKTSALPIVLMISVRADHGGGPRHMELLLKALSKEIEFHVACPDEPPYRARFENVVHRKTITIPHRRFSLWHALRLAAYAKRYEVDVIHTHGKGAGLYGRFVSLLTGSGCLHTPHGIHIDGYGAMQRTLYRYYENVTGRWLRHIVFVSGEEKATAKDFGLWPSLPRSVIPNGVENIDDASLDLMRDSTRRELGIPKDKLVATTISRFDYQKNMKEAYRVTELLPQLLFLWVGDGNDAPVLREKAEIGGLHNLRFLGYQDNPKAILAASDIYFSSSRNEGLPLAVLEAMSAGLPVVASDVNGHHELVGEQGGGFLYRLGDPDEAADLIGKLAADAKLRRSLGEQGRFTQRTRYSAQQMSKLLGSLYTELIGGPEAN